MSTTAAASKVALTADRPRRWLAERHSLRSEATTLVVLYGLYQLARGIVVGDPRDAVRHAHDVVTIEQLPAPVHRDACSRRGTPFRACEA